MNRSVKNLNRCLRKRATGCFEVQGALWIVTSEKEQNMVRIEKFWSLAASKRDCWTTKLSPLEEETRILGKKVSVLNTISDPNVSGIPDYVIEEQIKTLNEELKDIGRKWREQQGTSLTRMHVDETWSECPMWVRRMIMHSLNFGQGGSNLDFAVSVKLPDMWLVIGKAGELQE